MANIVSGVSFPSFAHEAAWSTAAAMDPDFPVSNLSDLVNLRRVALRTAVGATTLDFVLPAARSIDFLAIAHHNAGPAATVAIQLSSGVDPGANLVWVAPAQPLRPVADDSLFPHLFPHRLPAPVLARSGRLTFSPNDTPLEIGAIEIGRFWKWNDVSVPREIGIDSTANVFSGAGGVEHVTRQWSARTVRGERAVVDQLELDTTLLDFQRANGLWKPFVWCWDVSDPATWAREAMLVTNSDVQPGEVTDYLAGRMGFAFREHLL